MSQNDWIPTKITAAHQAKLAYVYIRQSSVVQILRHGESTTMQYRLDERATQLGWPRERVKLIDEDLGKSGNSSTHRPGFQRLTAEIGLDKVGLVLSLDASRLARNNSDWYQLIELCSLFRTLIADAETVYDPGVYTDRLLLGLSGMMSEAEMHHIKRRLHAGRRQKAERGELNLPLPVGLTRLGTGEVVFNPDEEVQSRLRLIFRKFKELGTGHAVARYLKREKLLVPSRPLLGPGPHKTLWQPALSTSVLHILRTPAYAGAYVFGRKRLDPSQRRSGRPYAGIRRQPVDKWPVLIQDRYPAYISWEEFLANQAQLQANQLYYPEDRKGSPRNGRALLQGIAICGRCSRRLWVWYTGDQGQYPVYVCNDNGRVLNSCRCQSIRANQVDAEVERVILAALEPDKIDIALAARVQLKQEYASLDKEWQLRLERARYETERARRQYNQVEPENRLVARSLESRWEEKLRLLEKAEQEYQLWTRKQRLELTPADEQDILALGEDLPTLWQASTTTMADRKRIVRLLIKEVILDQSRAQGKVWVQINWQTGAISQHWVIRIVSDYAQYAHFDAVEERIRALNAAHKTDEEIAATLNAEAFPAARGRAFTHRIVGSLRQRWGLSAAIYKGQLPLRWEDGAYSVKGVAAVIGVHQSAVYRWLQSGRIQGQQISKGNPWKITLTDEEIVSLKGYVTRVKGSKWSAP